MHPRGAIKLPRLPMKRAKQMSTMAKINKSVCAHYLIYNVCIYTKYLFTDIFEKFSDWMIQRNIDRMWQQTYLQLLYISSEEKDIKLNTKWARTKETDSGRKWNTKHKKEENPLERNSNPELGTESELEMRYDVVLMNSIVPHYKLQLQVERVSFLQLVRHQKKTTLKCIGHLST